ncbi:MAG: hypothetical protein ACRDT0_10040 [Pseudonocardiaceae bacterium]
MSLGGRLSATGRRTVRERLVTEVGDGLADLVVPVYYGIRGRQSGYLMHSYKDIEAPVRHNQTLLSVLLLAALDLHGGCIEHRRRRPPVSS